MNIRFDYSGKNVIVTGSGKGIGKSIAEAYAKAGAGVIIADICEESGRETAAEIGASGNRVAFMKTDITDEHSVKKLIQEAEYEFGHLDIMVNNAGAVGKIKGDPLTGMSAEDWDMSYKINLRGVFYCCRAIYDVFRRQGHGKICCRQDRCSGDSGVFGYESRRDKFYSDIVTRAGAVQHKCELHMPGFHIYPALRKSSTFI